MKPCGTALLAQDAALLVNPVDLGRGHTKLWLVHMGKYAFLAWSRAESDAREVVRDYVRREHGAEHTTQWVAEACLVSNTRIARIVIEDAVAQSRLVETPVVIHIPIPPELR